MIPFQDTSNIIVSGCSGSGKSHFVANLLRNKNTLFVTPPTNCIFVYKHWQPLYSELQRAHKEILFLDSLPTEDELKEKVHKHNHSLFICDDLISEIGSSSFISDVFTRLSHHLKTSTILLVQNLSMPGKFTSTLCRNAHVSVLMKSPREAYAIRSLGVQLNDYKNLLSVYKDATTEPFSYLVVDTHPLANALYKYRSKIFPTESEGPIIYLVK